MHEPQAFLNGRWVPASAAMVSPTDAGFVLGATVARAVANVRRQAVHLDDHIARLAHSVEQLGLKPDIVLDAMAETAVELVARNYLLTEPGDDLGLSIFVTPGVYPSYSTPEPIRPTVCLHTYALPFHLWVNKYREGQSLATTDVEQVSPRCWPADLKCRSRMHYYLADRKAAAIEPQSRALLLDAQGFVTEASTANLLVYNKSEGLASPPLAKVLHGISLSVGRQVGATVGHRLHGARFDDRRRGFGRRGVFDQHADVPVGRESVQRPSDRRWAARFGFSAVVESLEQHG